ncbi:NAD(P)-binding domain-containing protein [Sphaerisporangium corydalis]|uniref:NAD(P)-binding domain-containing protein n=1 Tax=Sphaerisporangium corydalis TaxID=1441875 RepID=A0ABV9E6J7_9ACTN|nr:NAD(P)-binding domain-containing protein [Sphaerisporangium corydalis]
MIAFLGLGHMGTPMARRLVQAGHQVTVWNRTPHPNPPMPATGAASTTGTPPGTGTEATGPAPGPGVVPGARVAGTAAEAVAGAELVITMLRDPAAVEEVLTSATPRPGSLVVEMSTIGPDAVSRLRSLLPAEVGLVDAPVLGSVQPAADGTLTILAGGSGTDLARCRDVLAVFGTVRELGPLGAGAAMKLAVMSALVPAQVLIAETLAYADTQGVDRAALLDVLAGTPLGPLAGRLRPAVLEGPQETRYALGLAAKDLTLAAHPAQTLAAAARTRLTEAEHAGLATADLTAITTSPTLTPSPTAGTVPTTDATSPALTAAPTSAAPATSPGGDRQGGDRQGGDRQEGAVPNRAGAVKLNPDSVPPPAGAYSHAVRAGDLLFVSGQAALGKNGEVIGEGDIVRQSECVMDYLEHILADQGCTFEDVVTIRTFLTDMADLPGYAAVRRRRITCTPPSSTTVEVPHLFRPGLLIEVEAVATIPPHPHGPTPTT